MNTLPFLRRFIARPTGIFTGVAFACLAFCLPAHSFTLVADGKPAATLVVPDDVRLVEQYAAQEFQYHARKASGAELPVLTESEAAQKPGSKIYFGRTDALKKAGFGGEDFGKYGYAGRLKDGSLFFYGMDAPDPLPVDIAPEDLLIQKARPLCWEKPVGTLLATYDFLESQLGARWIWPGETGVYVPEQSTIAVEQYDVTGKPRYVFNHMMPYEENAMEQRQWLLRQRFLRIEPSRFIVDHSFWHYWDIYKDTHPDIFAMWPDGTRTPMEGQPGDLMAMCVTNPDLVKLKVERWRTGAPALLQGRDLKSDGDFEKGYINVHENDVAAYCTCPACRAADAPDPRFANHDYWSKGIVSPFSKGGRWLRGSTPPKDRSLTEPSVTDRYMKFYLAVQKEAEKHKPGVTVQGQVYANYEEPPKEVKLNERIILNFVYFPGVIWTPEETRRTHAMWDAWQASGATLFLRPNTTNFRGHNMPDFYARQLGGTLKHLANGRLAGTNWDALIGQWAVQAPNFYMIARMLQHPDASVDEILGGFYAAFGPARDQVAAYFDHWDKVSNKLDRKDWDAFLDDASEMGPSGKGALGYLSQSFTPEAMARGRELLGKAVAAAKGDPAAEQRVKILDLGLRNAELTMDAFHAFRQINRKDTASQEKFVAAITKLEQFRAAHRGQYLNFGEDFLAERERQIWGDALRQIRAKEAT